MYAGHCQFLAGKPDQKYLAKPAIMCGRKQKLDIVTLRDHKFACNKFKE